MSQIDLLDQLLNSVVRPVVDTVSNLAISTAYTAKEHPVACAALVGLGAYAFHRGWLKVDRNRLHVNVNIDNCVFGYRTSTTFRLGGR